MDLLDFEGFYTNGSFFDFEQDEIYRYSFTNLFQYNERVYSTDLGRSSNINVLALFN